MSTIRNLKIDPEDMDVVSQINIKERKAFERFIKVYHRGEKIMTEGSSDNFLCLVRKGIVGVYREIDGKEELVTIIKSVNFVGEMELFLGGNRIGTVKALSSPATVCYEFKVTDMSAILANPNWSQKLISRLCADLKMFVGKALKLETENIRLTKEREQEKAQIQRKLDYLTTQNVLLFNTLNELNRNVASNVLMKPKDWAYMNSVNELLNGFLKERLPEVAEQVSIQEGFASLKELENNGNLPEKSRAIIKNIRALQNGMDYVPEMVNFVEETKNSLQTLPEVKAGQLILKQ